LESPRDRGNSSNRRNVANSNMMLLSDSLESGTGSSNSLRSSAQSLRTEYEPRHVEWCAQRRSLLRLHSLIARAPDLEVRTDPHAAPAGWPETMPPRPCRNNCLTPLGEVNIQVTSQQAKGMLCTTMIVSNTCASR
jgi:hypothetical protein